MSDKSIQWNSEYQEWEVCPTCLEIALEAAYSGGFSRVDDEVQVLVDEDWDEFSDNLLPLLNKGSTYD